MYVVSVYVRMCVCVCVCVRMFEMNCETHPSLLNSWMLCSSHVHTWCLHHWSCYLFTLCIAFWRNNYCMRCENWRLILFDFFFLCRLWWNTATTLKSSWMLIKVCTKFSAQTLNINYFIELCIVVIFVRKRSLLMARALLKYSFINAICIVLAM